MENQTSVNMSSSQGSQQCDEMGCIIKFHNVTNKETRLWYIHIADESISQWKSSVQTTEDISLDGILSLAVHGSI